MDQFSNSDIRPEEISTTLEHVVHVYQGNQDRIPDLIRDAGNLLVKVGKRLTTPQIIAGISVIAIGAILFVNYSRQHNKVSAYELSHSGE